MAGEGDVTVQGIVRVVNIVVQGSMVLRRKW